MNRPRAVADAVMKPSAILLAGAGASVAILGGLPLLLAPVIGAAAWAVRVAFALPKRQRPERMDLRSLSPMWRAFVKDALEAKARFDQAVRGTRPGPMQETLGGVGERVGAAVQAC